MESENDFITTVDKRRKMGYLFLAISLFSGSLKGYCSKKTSDIITSSTDAMATNLLRMVLCVAIGFLLICINDEIQFMACNKTTLLIALMSGVSTSIFLVSWLLSVKSGAYMHVEVMLMLGVFVPIVAGIFMFGNSVGIFDWLGVAILVLATFIMSMYNKSVKGKMSIKSITILLLCGLANGVTDLSQKMFVEYSADVPISVFNFYTYLFSGIVLSFVLPVFNSREKKTVEVKKIAGYVTVMAICLFMNSFFKTMAAQYFDPTQLYPVSQAMSLVLSTLMACVFFKEKLTAKAILGITLAFVGIVLINVL